MTSRGNARAAAALAALAIGMGTAGPATAQVGGGANNLVQVSSTAEGSFRHRASVQAAPYAGPSAQSTNLARADAHDCTGCRSTAAALQAVFLTGDPSTIQAANAAVATTSNCVSCTSYAYAYQYVITTRTPVSLSADGQRRLASLEGQADAVVGQQLPLAELDAQLEGLAAELRAVVDSELLARGVAADRTSFTDRQATS